MIYIPLLSVCNNARDIINLLIFIYVLLSVSFLINFPIILCKTKKMFSSFYIINNFIQTIRNSHVFTHKHTKRCTSRSTPVSSRIYQCPLNTFLAPPHPCSVVTASTTHAQFCNLCQNSFPLYTFLRRPVPHSLYLVLCNYIHFCMFTYIFLWPENIFRLSVLCLCL